MGWKTVTKGRHRTCGEGNTGGREGIIGSSKAREGETSVPMGSIRMVDPEKKEARRAKLGRRGGEVNPREKGGMLRRMPPQKDEKSHKGKFLCKRVVIRGSHNLEKEENYGKKEPKIRYRNHGGKGMVENIFGETIPSYPQN